MIERTANEMQEIWDAIAAALRPEQIKTMSKGNTTIRYIDRTDVEERLNAVCPGDWHFQITPIVTPETSKGSWVVKGTLTICGVTREDFGMNDNTESFDPPKAAASDALKRCASLFGFGRELYHDPAKTGNGHKPAQKPVQGQPSSTKPAATAGAKAQTVPPPPTQKAVRLPEAVRDEFRADVSARIAADDAQAYLISPEQAQGLVKLWKDKQGGVAHEDDARKRIVAFWFDSDPDRLPITSFSDLALAEHNVIVEWLKNDLPKARAEAAAILVYLDAQPEAA